MRIGKLDARITIQVNTPSRDGVGDEIDSWANLVTLWAEIMPKSGTEKQQGQQELAQDQTMFKIRSRSDITPKHRIIYNSDIYDIEHVFPVRRGKSTMIRAKRNVA